MCEDLGLQAELADSFAVLAGLLRGRGAGELDVVGAELIQSLCDFDLLRSVKVGIRKPVNVSVQGFFGSPCCANILLAFS